MNMEDASVVEVKELVLASSLDANDTRASERTQDTWRHAPTERGMDEAESRDHAILRAATQLLDGGLDFG